ncbi:MAG: RAMP superfamily CRISPR-associated protein [Chlorobium sp.]
MSAYPNPFDFVPFADASPVLKFPEEWLDYGPLRSGYLTVKLEALTPLHIVGEQLSHGNQIQQSLFYQRHGTPYIPGTSIRGVLRAFIEATCNCCASQITPFYVQKKKQHSIGFRVVENPELSETDKDKVDKSIPHALDSKIIFPASSEKGVDLASFLFGYVPEKTVDNNEKNNRDNAWKGRITIEDARIDNVDLCFDGENPYEIPDLAKGSAFMGGPHPSASSWWYQHPYKIIKDRSIKFIGSGYRGRKFYYHQDPFKCTQSYFKSSKWNPDDAKLYPIKLQCMKKGAFSNSFQIFFDDIPEVFLKLLIFAFELSPRICHKLGYGKAYGYGSVKFSVTDGLYHGKGFDDPIPISIDDLRRESYEELKNAANINENGLNQFLHFQSLDALAKILWFEEPFKYLFMYPCFGKGGFLQSKDVSSELFALLNKSQMDFLSKKGVRVNRQEGDKIAERLYGIKPALHFGIYQKNSFQYKELNEKRSFRKSLNV